MKKTRLAKQAAKRMKKSAFKRELAALREKTFVNNVPINEATLIEYREAKEALYENWYPRRA